MKPNTISNFTTNGLPKILDLYKQVGDHLVSPLKIVGSAGIDSEISDGSTKLTVGTTSQKFEILNLHTNERRWLGFMGVGFGVTDGGPAAGGSFSLASFPSRGSKIIWGPKGLAWKCSLEALEGETYIYTAAGGAGGGAAFSLLIFNYLVKEVFCTGFAFLAGASITTPGYGLMNFIGVSKLLP